MRFLTVIVALALFTTPALADTPPAKAAPAEVAAPAKKAEAPAEAKKAEPAEAKKGEAKKGDEAKGEAKKDDKAAAAGPEEVKVPETNADAGALVSRLLNAADNGHWTVVAGLILLLLMWAFNKFGLAKKIGRKYVPWVTVAIGVAGSVGIALAQGSPIMDAVKLGIIEGGLAIALWELMFKSKTKTKSDGEERAPAAPAA